MKLSADTHAFLHGAETTVAGSTVGGDVLCANEKCAKLKHVWKTLRQKGATWQQCKEMECGECAQERASRCRVLGSGAAVPPGFEEAVCIVPNNDTRTEINKMRARAFARQTLGQLQWSMAEDTVTAKALNADPDLGRRKIEFLTWTDRMCGNLSGLVPLVKKMPMFLTEHIERSAERSLLKGQRCVLEDWVLDKEERQQESEGQEVMLKRQPICVVISFPGATWKLDCMPQPGWYPVKPVKKMWYVDHNKKSPQLGIVRKQLPLCPAFAGTANFVQGQNLGNVLADVNMPAGTCGQTCYVALSRVKNRESIWLLREFPLEMFNKEKGPGPEVLLQHLRGEDVDWEKMTDMIVGPSPEGAEWKPRLTCAECGLQAAEHFAKQELERGAARVCKFCKPPGCSRCGGHVAEGHLCAACAQICEVCGAANSAAGGQCRCRACVRKVQCGCCGVWMESKKSRRMAPLCEACEGAVPCGRCTQLKRKQEFSVQEGRTPSAVKRKKLRRCNSCLAEEAEAYAEMRRATAKKARQDA